MAGNHFRHPARLVVGGFASAVVLGTALLSMPLSTRTGVHVGIVDTYFTATSAVCVTGLTTVDTGTTWTLFGTVVIGVLAQIGGLGIMTVASLVALSLSRRLGIRTRRLMLVEAGSIEPGDLRSVLQGILLFAGTVEVVVTVLLSLRFWTHYDMGLATALGHGAFTSVMAFNNAGFGLASDSLSRFVHDWFVNGPVMVAVVVGGLGFPVLVELLDRHRAGYRSWRRNERHPARPQRLTLHTRLTLVMTAALLLTGLVVFAALEWTNSATLGAFDVPQKLLAAMFHSVSTRTAGFNTVDIGSMRETTWVITDLFMFTGSGSASTGGGLKVTTVAVLVLVCLAEARGDEAPSFAGRTVPGAVLRQAVTVTLVSIAAAGFVTTFLLAANPLRLDTALFEAVSAFGTVGLSTGVTASVSTASKLLLSCMMFFGRVGPLTLSYAFVTRARSRRFHFPEERPLVG